MNHAHNAKKETRAQANDGRQLCVCVRRWRNRRRCGRGGGMGIQPSRRSDCMSSPRTERFSSAGKGGGEAAKGLVACVTSRLLGRRFETPSTFLSRLNWHPSQTLTLLSLLLTGRRGGVAFNAAAAAGVFHLGRPQISWKPFGRLRLPPMLSQSGKYDVN